MTFSSPKWHHRHSIGAQTHCYKKSLPQSCCCSVTPSCLTLCDPMGCCMPGFPVLHHLLKFSQSHVQWVGDAIQPSQSVDLFSCPQSFPASGSFPVSWLLTSGGQKIGVLVSASVLPVNIPGWFPLQLTGFISLLSRDFQESSPTPQFKSINSSVLSLLYSPTLTCITWLLEKPYLWWDGPLSAK